MMALPNAYEKRSIVYRVQCYLTNNQSPEYGGIFGFFYHFGEFFSFRTNNFHFVPKCLHVFFLHCLVLCRGIHQDVILVRTMMASCT